MFYSLLFLYRLGLYCCIFNIFVYFLPFHNLACTVCVFVKLRPVYCVDCEMACVVADLFYTRVMPSKMFDVLKEDFDYFFISSVLLGMITVSIISQKLAARRALNRAWK